MNEAGLSMTQPIPSTDRPVRSNARQALLDCAIRLLAAGGQQEATARAICSEVGVKAPALYHHYGDLNGLYQAAIDSAFEQVVTCYPLVADGPLEKVRESWLLFMRFATEQPRLALIVVQQTINGETPSMVLRAFRSLVGDLGELAMQGRLTTSPERAAQLLWSAALGAAALAARATEDERLDASVSASMLELLLAGLVVPAVN